MTGRPYQHGRGGSPFIPGVATTGIKQQQPQGKKGFGGYRGGLVCLMCSCLSDSAKFLRVETGVSVCRNRQKLAGQSTGKVYELDKALTLCYTMPRR